MTRSSASPLRLVRLADVTAAEAYRVLDALSPRQGSIDLRPRGYLLDLAIRGPEEILEDLVVQVREAFAERVYGVGEDSLAAVVIERLRRAGMTVSTAESCTGGWVGAALTSIAGASTAYWGGIVAYDDAAKMEWLGVRPEALRRFGAVSEEVALEMARGLQRRSGTSLAVAVTGIAGPGGGTVEKPVGTVWIASAGPREASRRFRFAGGRREVRKQAVQATLDEVRRCCPATG